MVLIVHNDDTIDGEPGPPFTVFFDPDVRQFAVRQQGRTTESGTQTGDVVGLNNDLLVAARTLLVYGAKDSIAGPQHGKWYQRRLPDARYEQVPTVGHLLVIPMWRRVLSHLAPRSKR